LNHAIPKLAAYLERIGFGGTARPDLETLRELQRVHVRAVPFENLDVQLRRTVGFDLDTCFDKIVRQRRGGWCFELNGLLGWALREIGFDVVRISAGVMREHLGDVQMGNHLCLLVRTDRPYLVDVGFGGSLSQPLPLEGSGHDHSPYRIMLTDMGDGYWRFSERAYGEPFSFDFCIGTADETRFAEKCAMLQTSPDSPFVQNLVAQRRMGDTHISLRGRVLTTLHASGEEKAKLASVDEFVAALRDKFDLDVPEVATLWPAICARHDALFEDHV
jgi:N-hydroxyarylamine O-acetyltransferase